MSSQWGDYTRIYSSTLLVFGTADWFRLNLVFGGLNYKLFVVFNFSSYLPNRGISFSMVPLLWPGGPGFHYRRERRAFHSYRLGGPPNVFSEYQCLFTSPGGQSGREANHSPPFSNNWVELYLHSPILLLGVVFD
jgi:hypothetical protein